MAEGTGRGPDNRPLPPPGAGPVSIEDTEVTKLNRVITRPMLTFFILGAGIYALTGEVAGDVGSVTEPAGPRGTAPPRGPASSGP